MMEDVSHLTPTIPATAEAIIQQQLMETKEGKTQHKTLIKYSTTFYR
jgi:hypothetical protein